jgi:hypothetical protein
MQKKFRIGSRGRELRKPHFMSNLVFSPPFIFHSFFDRATDRTAGPIVMVDGSNDVFSREKLSLGIK